MIVSQCEENLDRKLYEIENRPEDYALDTARLKALSVFQSLKDRAAVWVFGRIQ